MASYIVLLNRTEQGVASSGDSLNDRPGRAGKRAHADTAGVSRRPRCRSCSTGWN